jgi:hypothetical protein
MTRACSYYCLFPTGEGAENCNDGNQAVLLFSYLVFYLTPGEGVKLFFSHLSSVAARKLSFVLSLFTSGRQAIGILI